MAVVGIFIPVFAGMHPTITLPMGLMLAMLPMVWLVFRRRRRFKQFAKQLPDALELMLRALRAGHSLASGFSLVAEEMQPPIGEGIRPRLRGTEPRHAAGKRSTT